MNLTKQQKKSVREYMIGKLIRFSNLNVREVSDLKFIVYIAESSGFHFYNENTNSVVDLLSYDDPSGFSCIYFDDDLDICLASIDYGFNIVSIENVLNKLNSILYSAEHPSFEEKFKKLTEILKNNARIDICNFGRLMHGSLSHVGDWIAEGKSFEVVVGTVYAAGEVDVQEHDFIYTPEVYRLTEDKPYRTKKTMNVDGVAVVMPETTKPNLKDTYYTFEFTYGKAIIADVKWRDDNCDNRSLKNGFVWLSYDDAKLYVETVYKLKVDD